MFSRLLNDLHIGRVHSRHGNQKALMEKLENCQENDVAWLCQLLHCSRQRRYIAYKQCLSCLTLTFDLDHDFYNIDLDLECQKKDVTVALTSETHVKWYWAYNETV